MNDVTENHNTDEKVSLKLIQRRYDEEAYMSNGGWINNCHIEPREGENWYSINRHGAKIVTLDGYAIIPKEKYHALLDQQPPQLKPTWLTRFKGIFKHG